MNICQCGTQSGGYPHAEDCPWPYYGRSTEQVNQWQKARQLWRAGKQALFAIAEDEQAHDMLMTTAEGLAVQLLRTALRKDF